MFLRANTWSTAVGGAALLALGAVGCGAYEPEPEYPQYEYAPPPPARAPSDDLLAQNMNMDPNVGGAPAGQPMGTGPEVAIGDGKADEYSDTDPSALNEFKPALEGHGQWVDDATYGTVWVPSQAEVGTDFQPYSTAGHWTYSDETDYVWVSDYSWGWAPFHYGRWANVGPYGWSWIPGRQYSGAWVSWRVGPAGYGYVGWGPMAPDWYWYHGTAVGWSFGYYHPYDHYVYCDRGHLYDHGVGRYAVGGPAGRTYYEHTVAYAPSARVAANPSVGGNGRVAAQPTVGGRGPTPNEMGIGREAVASPPASNQGLNQARALATPSSAVAHGAAAPFRTASTNSGQSTGGFAAGSRGPASTAMTNGAGSPASRQNGNAQAGSAFASRSTPVSRNPTAPSNSTGGFRPSTSTYTPGRAYQPAASAYASHSSTPSFRSSSSSVQSYSHAGSSSSFSHSSAPSVHSSSSSGSSSFSHSSSSSGRSGGGGGGGHSSGGHRR